MALTPAYLDLDMAELEARRDTAVASLRSCRVCPRNCEVNRSSEDLRHVATRVRKPICGTWRQAWVGSHFPHFGEEDCLRGSRGSGTIFFSCCNLKCVFCQNCDISQEGAGRPVDADQLATMMLELQALGCHNINFVTPEHVVPQLLEGLVVAIERGLRLPIVYNTSAYDALESLAWMDGIVDIYMPDFKFWSVDACKRLTKAPDYREVAGADVDARDDEDETPIFAAVNWGDVAAVDALISAGADLEVRNEDGEGLWEAAEGESEVRALLTRHRR